MNYIKVNKLLEWLINKLRIPWLGTAILVILGTLGTLFPLTLFYGVQLLFGTAAAFIALRLHGAIYGFTTLIAICALGILFGGLVPSSFFMIGAHFIELIWMLGWQIRWKNGSIMKANAAFWVVMLLPVEGQEHRPIEVAILAAFLFYRYKFVSRAKDKNLYRLPEWTRT